MKFKKYWEVMHDEKESNAGTAPCGASGRDDLDVLHDCICRRRCGWSHRADLEHGESPDPNGSQQCGVPGGGYDPGDPVLRQGRYQLL